jgi:phosphate-selective porin OprO/OprP
MKAACQKPLVWLQGCRFKRDKPDRKSNKKQTNMKLNQLILAAVVGVQFAIPAWAAEGEATNVTGAAQSVSPASATGGSAAASAETSEIENLKKEIQALDQKVQNLEQQDELEQQAATATNQEQIRELDQKVRILSRQHELDQESAEATARLQPRFKMDSSGFAFSSADTNFAIGIHGLVQMDSRTYFGDNNVANSGFLLRRARPIITGTVFHDFDFNLTPDFAGTVQILDAYINYHYNPGLQLETGKFKPPIGLEALQSDANLYLNERSLVTDLVPNRDIGVELHGEPFGGAISYAAGVFDGAPDYSSTTSNTNLDSDLAFDGRIFLQPWIKSDANWLRGLGFGVGGSYENASGVNGLTSGYTTDGQQRFFAYSATTIANGQHWRVSPQAYYYWGPLGIMSEYAISDQKVRTTPPAAVAQGDLGNTAWEVQGGWILTGEDASYTGVTPRHPFNLRGGGWGAWQVVGRYEQLNVDNSAFPTFASSAVSASAAHAWSVGFNWYLNRNIRFNASYSQTTFSGYTGPSPAVPAKDEQVFFTRIQLAF